MIRDERALAEKLAAVRRCGPADLLAFLAAMRPLMSRNVEREKGK